LSISISTGGKAPALAKRLRAELSEQFGPEWGALVDMLAEARAEAIGERDVDFETWAERWQVALDHDLVALVRDGRGAEAREVVRDRLGRPSLWEGKAAVDAGKEPGSHRVDQEQINALLVRLAGEGKRVVRLKGGDPFVFGRGAEEAEALAGAGVPFEVVPAPTSAVAAAASAGIPVTDRRWSSSVAIVTGHCASGDVDWAALATAVDTIVVLMGLGRLGEIAGRLIAAGRSPHTPAAVVEN